MSKLVGLEDVMGQPLAAGMMKSVELSPTSSTGEPEVSPPTKRRTLHERAASDPDVILDLESPAKASRRTSSLRPLGAQVLLHSVFSKSLNSSENQTTRISRTQFKEYCGVPGWFLSPNSCCDANCLLGALQISRTMRACA